MRVAINQSSFFPWKGYFDIINSVDTFVFLDDVQFTKRDWRHRNLIKFHTGTRWIRASVHEDVTKTIDQTKFKEQIDWQKETWDLLHEGYKKAKYFDWIRPLLETVLIQRKWDNLSQLNQYVIEQISREYLGITTKFTNSKDFNVTSTKQSRILDLVKAAGGTRYLSGPLAKAYIDIDHFKREGVTEVTWQDYSGYPEYKQFWPPFEHAVSIVDLLAHTGPEAPKYIWGWRKDTVASNEKALFHSGTGLSE